MADMPRRELLGYLALAPAAAVIRWQDAGVARATEFSRRATQQFEPAFFTPHEYGTVRMLVDIIIPRDERSGSATDAGVPEFMDFIMIDQPAGQTAMRGGLAWLDDECLERFERPFIECAGEQRRQVLDDIAWPDRAPDHLSHGVAFFNSFRDLTATGYWSSRMGVEDLQYRGNTVAPNWAGCPEEQLRRLGVRYD